MKASRRVPSQRDIAIKAGVSQSTVSIVLNDRSEAMGIPPQTQDRIRRAIEELQYVPNVAARALRKGRNDLIGVYTFEPVFPMGPDDYYSEFLHGIEEEAVSIGVDLVLFTSALAPQPGASGVYRSGSNRLGIADGTVMLGSRKSDEELTRLREEGYPFVFIGRRGVPNVVIPSVTADYHNAMSSVLELLTSFGHESVLYVGARARIQPQEERLNGFNQFAKAIDGLVTRNVVVERREIDGPFIRDSVSSGCTAIVAETAELGRAIVEAAQGQSLTFPEDLSLVVLDVGVRYRGADVSHVGVPRRAMGSRAVSLLVELIEGGDLPNSTVVLDCSPPGDETVSTPPRLSSSSHDGVRVQGPRIV